MPPAEVERLKIAKLLWGLLKARETTIAGDAELSAELLRDVLTIKDKDPDLTPDLFKLIDDTGREWDTNGIERALHPGISRIGLQCLAVLHWAEGIIDAQPSRPQDFRWWCQRVVFGGDPQSLTKPVQPGHSHDYQQRAERLFAAAAAFGIVDRPEYGPLTFDELRAYAGRLCDAVDRPNREAVPAVPTDLPRPNAQKTTVKERQRLKEDRVMMAVGRLKSNPERTAKAIAAEVGLSETTLSRSPLWQAAKRALINAPPPRGRRHDDGSIEADAADDAA